MAQSYSGSIAISSLLLQKVKTKSGKSFGRVFDIKVTQVKNRYRVTHIVCGTRGLLERLGMRKSVQEEISWTRVKKISQVGIIVLE